MRYTEVELLLEEMRQLLEFLEWDRDQRNKCALHIHERADSATHCPTLLPSHGETAAFEEDLRALGIGTGNPGVFQGYPHPYPRKPVPVSKGTGFDGYGYGFCKNPGVSNLSAGMSSKTD